MTEQSHHPPRPAIIGAVLDAWQDLERVIARMTDEEALDTSHGSPYAWTVGHLANQADTWINVRFAGQDPHPIAGRPGYRSGQIVGPADSWSEVVEASRAVRSAATAFLDGLSESDLDRTITYPGPVTELRGRQIELRYGLLRVLAHHYFHIGEIASKRSAAGKSVGDYPGVMSGTANLDV
jgi:hypothetical protein